MTAEGSKEGEYTGYKGRTNINNPSGPNLAVLVAILYSNSYLNVREIKVEGFSPPTSASAEPGRKRKQ